MIAFLIVMFCVATLYMAGTSRIEAYIKVLSLQGFIILCMIIVDYDKIDTLGLIFLLIEAFLIKTIIIPYMLLKAVRKHGIFREIEPYISNFNSLVVSTFIIIFGFLMSYLSLEFTEAIKPLRFGVSISTIIVGLFLIMSRKKLITHIMGYMIIENGIFLLSLSIASEMPLLVNLGVLLDIFMAIYILLIFFNRILLTFDEIDIDQLNKMKE